MIIKYKSDIDTFLATYENSHPAPYFRTSKSEIFAYLKNQEIKDDYDFNYIIRCMIKKLNNNLDPHTCIRYNNHKNIPVFLKLFEEGLYIIKTTDEYKFLFGKKITCINGISIDTLIEEAEKAVSYNTEGFKRFRIARTLNNIEGILMLPSIDSTCTKLSFKFDEVDNEVIFKKNEIKSINFKEDNFTYKIYSGTIVFKYNLCKIDYKNQMEDIVNELKNEINKNNINNFILDLRNNYGGGSEYINPLIDYLKLTKLFKVVLTNGNVFSSAIMAIQKMDAIGSYFIGDFIGSTVNHFGNLDCQVALPNTGLKAFISTKYFGGKYVIKNQVEFRNLDPSLIKTLNFKPNKLVAETLADTLDGYDRILNTALDYCNQKTKKENIK